MSKQVPLNKPRKELTERRTPHQERAQRTVRRILDAAYKVLDRKGIENYTMREIAKEGSLSIGSIYSYFPSREAVLYRIYEECLERQIAIYNSVFSDANLKRPYGELIKEYFQILKACNLPSKVETEIRSSISTDEKLRSMTQHFEQFFNDSYVRILKHYGSPWDESKLQKLGNFVRDLNQARVKAILGANEEDIEFYNELMSVQIMALIRHTGAKLD